MKYENNEVSLAGMINNSSGNTVDISAIYCIYNENGKIIKIVQKPIKAENTTTPLEYNFNTADIPDLHKVTVFVFNGTFNSKAPELLFVSDITKGGNTQ